MDCRQGNERQLIRWRRAWDLDWASTPPLQMSLLVKVSTSYAHLLLEAIATNFGTYPSTRSSTHSSTAWVLLTWLAAKLPKIVQSYF